MKRSIMKRVSKWIMRLFVVWSIALLFISCSSDDHKREITETESYNPEGIFNINASGGNGGRIDGAVDLGGAAVVIGNQGSSGTVEVLQKGKADASFEAHVMSPNLGSTPITISGNSLIQFQPDNPPKGEVYSVYVGKNIDAHIKVSDGDGDLSNDPVVTGITIEKKASLSFQIPGQIQFVLENDLVNHGKIMAQVNGANLRSRLVIAADSFYGSAGSMIDNGGKIPGESGGHVTFFLQKRFVNHGAVALSGVSHDEGDGGSGAHFTVSAVELIENHGQITAGGGDGSPGFLPGGRGVTTFRATKGSIHNSGDILDSRGAIFTAGIDEITGEISSGSIVNSGEINTSGYDASNAKHNFGGGIKFHAYGGSIISSGNITTAGGEGRNGNGGSGGSISMIALIGYDENNMPAYPHIELSGNIDTHGGSASIESSFDGGRGGIIDIRSISDSRDLPLEVQANDIQPDGSVRLLGYDAIVSHGGDANIPGSGGYIGITSNGRYWDGSQYRQGPAGGIRNEANLSGNGGNVLQGSTSKQNGGNGSRIQIIRIETDDSGTTSNTVVNTGNLKSAGGHTLTGFDAGGYGDLITVANSKEVQNSGDVTSKGGNGGIAGGDAKGIIIGKSSPDPSVKTINTGTLISVGGIGEEKNGQNGNIDVQ